MADKNSNIIQINGLRKIFSDGINTVIALDGISLDIREGEIFGIIGLSGAGKSTLVRCINLLEIPTEGSVIVDGRDMALLNETELLEARRKIGMIFQSFNLLQQRTALENVCFPLEIAGVRKEEARTRAKALLETVGLGNRIEAYPSQLSGGMQQRVAIARALANEPKVLLCDEATSALDPKTTLQILELLQKINKELGVTIVVITHEMKVIERICSRVAILADSKVVEGGEVSEVFRHPKTPAARQLIFPQGEKIDTFHGGKRLLRLAFDGTTTDQPIVANMVLSCGEAVSILAADTKVIEGKTVGQMVLQLPENEAAAERMLAYLDQENISYTEGE
jgi:D-methionine transport system ATP-binding protein